MSRVEVRGVTKSFGPVRALRGIDLDVPSEHLVAVLGPSGCGKTTLLRIIAGFEHQDAGSVALDGVTVMGPPERRRVGIVPQEGALFPHLDVAGNVGFGVSRDRRRRRVSEMLELVGLSGYERRRPHELSGGQQQRVALARALAPAPAVVLLDEPFTALDAGLRASLRADVAALLRATGTTALLVTHDQTEALSMADVVAVMRDGAIVQADSPARLYAEPADLQTAEFLGDAVVVHGDADGTCVSTVLGQFASGVRAGATAVVLRPEQLVRDETSRCRATVAGVSFHGHDALIALDLDGLALTARWTGDLPRLGDVVGVRVSGPVLSYAEAPRP